MREINVLSGLLAAFSLHLAPLCLSVLCQKDAYIVTKYPSRDLFMYLWNNYIYIYNGIY